MAAGPGETTLGVFLRERTRSIVALSADGEAGVALRDLVAPSQALVRDVRPHECAAALAACVPWPWMVAGYGVAPPPALHVLLRTRPVLTVWTAVDAGGLPPQTRRVDRFSELAHAVTASLTARVGPMRLASGGGVDIDGGRHVNCAALETLVAAHPHGFALPLRTFRAAAHALRELDIPWQPARDPASGQVRLMCDELLLRGGSA